MASPILTAVVARLVDDTGDGGVVSYVDTYKTKPAVFRFTPVPDDVEVFVIVDGAISDESGRLSKQNRIREVQFNVRCFGPTDGDPGNVEDLAERIRTLFHERNFSVDGFGLFSSLVSGPIVAPTSGNITGRLLTIRLTLEED